MTAENKKERFPIGFWAWAQKYPERTAIVSEEEESIPAGEFLALINRISHGYRSLGLTQGDGVALLMGNEPAWVACALASSQIGQYHTPINYHLVGEEVAYILQDCEAKVFIAGEAYADAAIEAVEQTGFPKDRCFASGHIDGFRPLEELYDGHPDSLPDKRLYGGPMMYTSGTTGRPKGVRRPTPPASPEAFAQVASAAVRGAGYPIGGGMHLVTGPLYHAAPGGLGLPALHIGEGLVLMHKWTAERTLALIEKYKITSSHLVPTMFVRLLKLPDEVKQRYDLSSLEGVLHGAAPCPVETKRRMIEWWGPVIIEYYASTESGGTAISAEDWLAHPGSVGKPNATTTIKILDDDFNELPPGATGTIWIKTAGQPFEYFKDDDKTRKARYRDFVTIGDVGYVDEDGWLYLSDRKADMIISGGVNIYSAEIEKCLIHHPAVHDVAVFGIPDDEMGERVMAVIELMPEVKGDDALRDDIDAYARTHLAGYKIPREIDFRAELPRQPSGKLYKRHLRDEYWKATGRNI